MDWWTTDVCTSTTATSPAAPTSDSSAAVVAVLCPGLPGSIGSLLLLPLLGDACLCSDAGVFPVLQSCGAALDDRFRHMVWLLRAGQMCLYCGLRCRLRNTHDRRALWRRHGTCSDHFLQGGVRRRLGLATPVGDLVAHFSECSSHDTCALMCLLWSLGHALGVQHDGLLQLNRLQRWQLLQYSLLSVLPPWLWRVPRPPRWCLPSAGESFVVSIDGTLACHARRPACGAGPPSCSHC